MAEQMKGIQKVDECVTRVSWVDASLDYSIAERVPSSVIGKENPLRNSATTEMMTVTETSMRPLTLNGLQRGVGGCREIGVVQCNEVGDGVTCSVSGGVLKSSYATI